MHGYHTQKCCTLPKIEITWISYGETVSKIMTNDCKASSFVDQLHSDNVNYSVKFL